MVSHVLAFEGYKFHLFCLVVGKGCISHLHPGDKGLIVYPSDKRVFLWVLWRKHFFFYFQQAKFFSFLLGLVQGQKYGTPIGEKSMAKSLLYFFFYVTTIPNLKYHVVCNILAYKNAECIFSACMPGWGAGHFTSAPKR